MVAYAGQAILHATIAALVVEALLRLWRVEDPGERLALRWTVLACPFLTAALVTLVPSRSTEEFSLAWAVFAGVHWDELRLGQVGVATGATWALTLLGIALYLRDMLPALSERADRRAQQPDLPDTHPAVLRVRGLMACLESPGLPAITIAALDSPAPVLLCRGVDRPRILVSTGTLSRLDDGELRAALAHEVAHVRARDPLMGWGLMVARTLQCFNPVVQIVGRQAILDIERRADGAVMAEGHARALARAIAKLAADPEAQSDLVPPARLSGAAERLRARAHRHAVDDRCQRLADHRMAGVVPLRAARIALAAIGLTAVLYFVV